MSRSCHRATSSRPAPRLPRRTRARPARRSHVMGLRLWGMAELPFCPARNGSAASPTSVRWRWRISVAIISIDGADRGARPQVLGVAVAGDDLGGGHRREAEGGAHVGLDPGVDVGVGADRARELAHGDGVAGPSQAVAVAVGLEGPVGELDAEGGGLGVHAVGAAGHRGVAELEGPGLEGGDELGRWRRTRRSAAWVRVAHRAVSTTSLDVRP